MEDLKNSCNNTVNETAEILKELINNIETMNFLLVKKRGTM